MVFEATFWSIKRPIPLPLEQELEHAMCSKLFDRYSQSVMGTVFTSWHCSAVTYGEVKINVFLRRTSSHSQEIDYFTSHLGGFPPDPAV
jgi:hypothetical protein